MPCYNVENTINRCINSVINQSFNFENIELIIYDDGSTDSTKRIIQDYVDKYENIIFINSNKNQGPGTGRNEGIKLATSDYIMFIDSDDEYDTKLCEVIYDTLSNFGCDLVCCGNINIFDNDFTELDISKRNFNKIKLKKENMLYIDDIFIFDKIYKKSILINNNILFPEHKYGEDFQFNMRYLVHCKEIILLPDYIGYYRHVQQNSISRSWSLEDLSNIIQTFSDTYEELIKTSYNINFNILFKNHVQYILIRLYIFHLLDDKSQAIHLLDKLYSFEQEISFNGKLDTKLVDIANRFLLKKQFKFSFYCLKFLEKLYDSDIIKGIYRKIIK